MQISLENALWTKHIANPSNIDSFNKKNVNGNCWAKHICNIIDNLGFTQCHVIKKFCNNINDLHLFKRRVRSQFIK